VSVQRRLLEGLAPPAACVSAVPRDTRLSFYEVDPLRDYRWAALLARHPRASAFHSVPWLTALQRTYGYKPVVYTTSPPGDEIDNGLVFCRVNSWITGRRLVSLPFSDHCEPLIDSNRDMEALFDGLRGLRGSANLNYVELRPASPAVFTSAADDLRPCNEYYLHVIDLGSSETELFARFHRDSIQRRVRRAERAGLTYESGRSLGLLRKFYGLFMLTRRRHRIPPQPGNWFANLLECMGEALEVHVASYQGKPVAAVITLLHKNTVTYKYGGSDQDFHHLGSMPFVLWKSIQKAQAIGAQTFDLGRSEAHNIGGVTFKDRWDSRRSVLTYWRFSRPAQAHSLARSHGFRLAQTFFGMLPDPLLKLTGALMYRHIG
jgi:hypothetical protein